MPSNIATFPTLDESLPSDSLPSSQISQQKLPEANWESLVTLQGVLKDNHQCHHIFWNDKSFHNHVTHRALAIYALGGFQEIIRDYYKRDNLIQRPAFESPKPITKTTLSIIWETKSKVLFSPHPMSSFDTHRSFYQAYVNFFSKQISEKGSASTLEEFVFSEKFNVHAGRHANAQPEMLGRFLSSLLQPFIHVAYGVEFGLKGMHVEGLALAAVKSTPVWQCVPSSYFVPVMINGLESRLSGAGLNAPAAPCTHILCKTGGVHAFDIVARMLRDDRLKRNSMGTINQFSRTLVEYAPIIRGYAEKWSVDSNHPTDVQRKMEELIWLSSLLYGVGRLKKNGHRSDFFLMHLVISSHFLRSFAAYVSPTSQALLLRAYLVTVLTWWVLRGRPTLDIKSFMATTSTEPSVSTTPNLKGKATLTTATTKIPNPFLPILQSAITHPNDHLIKIQRAFARLDTLYGGRPAGYFEGTELEGAELLDGTLFLRCALLTADSIGSVHEDQEAWPSITEGLEPYA